MARVPPSRGLDDMIHQRVRLAVMGALAAGGAMTFNDVKTTIGATDGNLSVHARVLEDAGYIRIDKTFERRRPKTTLEMTPRGRTAFKDYLSHLERIISRPK